ncbi:MAG: serine/threonine-protein kinase, partial [Terriglobia bacterium]
MSENLLFGRYEILEKLGDGGSSEVSRAFDTRMEREVAIKKVASHPRARERALREAKTVASLNHPNIVTLFDFVESSDNYFLIMEYLKGHALSAILRLKTRLSEPEVVAVGQQVCRALEYAHANGVIHRDI